MKKISFVGSARYGGGVLTVIQGILLIAVSIFLINQQYINAWQNYPTSHDVLTVYLKDVAVEKQADTLDWLIDTADHDGLYLVRQDRLAADTGTTGLLKVCIYGKNPRNYVPFMFINQEILSVDNLKKLQTSPIRSSTLGVEIGSISSLGAIPYLRFGERVAVKKLIPEVIDTNTVNGTYHIVGLRDYAQKAKFIKGLSAVSGMAENEITNLTGGMAEDNGLVLVILLGMLAVEVFLSILFFVAVTVKNLPKLGKLALMGWSRSSFAKKLFGGFLVVSISEVPILVGFGWLLAGWNGFQFYLLGVFFVAAIYNIVLAFAELLIASSIIFMTKLMDSIRGRIPKKPLYAMGIIAYLIVSIGIVVCCFSVDEPISELYRNAKLAQKWQSVSNYQIMTLTKAEGESDYALGRSQKFCQKVYRWYTSICNNDGVYLIHTQYNDMEALQDWRKYNLFKTIPEKPFWYYEMSPNYLKKLGIKISEKDIAKAQAGTRLYLLPDTLTHSQAEKMRAFLHEEAMQYIPKTTPPTVFTKNKDFKFITYKPSSEFFTWGTKTDQTATEKAPIIYVSTPKNMTFFESESLCADGLENSLIKFDSQKTMVQYTSSRVLKKFNLLAKNIPFNSVRIYIDGLQKSMEAVLLGIGLGVIFLFAILIGLLVTLASIFRIANQEKINVKKFLGFDFWRLYKAPMCMLSGVIILEIGVMLVHGSKFGLLLMLIIAILQIIIFSRYMARSELKQLLIAFKGE